MNDLLQQIHRLHTTTLGVERIRRNLELETEDVVSWCAKEILRKDALLERIGKNWYITVDQYQITVNAYSYTIITAHRIKNSVTAN